MFFFQLEEQVGSGFGPLLPVTSPFPAHSLRLPCPAFNYYTLACPRRIYTTPRPGAAVHRTAEYIAQVLPLPQVYISTCTYLCTSLYLYLYLYIDLYLSAVHLSLLPPSQVGGYLPSPSLPAAARLLLLLPHLGSASVLSHDITFLYTFAFSPSLTSFLFSRVSLLYFFPNPGPSQLSGTCQNVAPCPPPSPLLSRLALRINSPSTHTHVHRPSQPVRCLSHMGVPMPAAVPHHRTLHCIACIVSRLALLLLWTNCSR